MSEGFVGFILGLGIGALIIVLVILSIPEHTAPYKMGQIDALTGKVEYQLVDKPDGTRVWERK